MSDQSTTTPLEIVADESKELLAVVQQNALPAEAAQALQSSFAPAFTEARTILQQSRNIVVTDASQKLQIKLAGDYRKALKAIRVGADKTRKELKDESLRRGKAIDGMYNILLHLTETEEKRLQAQEDFAEVQEAKRKEALKLQRTEIMLGIQADPNLYNLAEMGEETFQQLVEGVKLARAAAVERQRKEEADRIAKEAADAAERERIRLENERLKKEADEKAAAEKADRERRQNLHAERRAVMQPFVESGDESANGFYGDMADDQFGEAKAGAENRRAARLTAEQERARLEAVAAEERRKAAEAAETARKEREAAEARAAEEKRQAALVLAEQKRVAEEAAAAERKRVDAEREVAAKKAAAEKKAAEDKARKEREAREKAEAELRQQREAEAARKADEVEAAKRVAAAEAEAAKKAAAAPDRVKLMQLSSDLRDVGFPACATREGQTVAANASAKLEALILWIESQASAL